MYYITPSFWPSFFGDYIKYHILSIAAAATYIHEVACTTSQHSCWINLLQSLEMLVDRAGVAIYQPTHRRFSLTQTQTNQAASGQVTGPYYSERTVVDRHHQATMPWWLLCLTYDVDKSCSHHRSSCHGAGKQCSRNEERGTLPWEESLPFCSLWPSTVQSTHSTYPWP